MSCHEFSIPLRVFRRWKHDRTLIPQVDFHSGFEFQFMRELGIHLRASSCQRLQSTGSFEGAVDQHAAGGVGGFAAGFSTLDDEDRGAALAEGDGERQADDASAYDDYVPSLHRGIVKERGRERSVSDVACTALPVQAREPSLRLKKRTPPRMTPIGGEIGRTWG